MMGVTESTGLWDVYATMRTDRLVACALVVLGCGGRDSPESPDATTPTTIDGRHSPDAPPLRPVTGRIVDRYTNAAGTIGIVPDLATIEIVAISPSSAPVTVTPAVDGSFGFSIPEGDFFLRVTRASEAPEFSAWTTELLTELFPIGIGRAFVMRADAAVATSAATAIDASANGFLPIAATDVFELFSEGASSVLADRVAPSLVGGTTYAHVFGWQGAPLVVGSQSDRVAILQLATRQSGAQKYVGLAREVDFAAFDLADGSTATPSATAIDLPLRTSTLFWKRTAFGALGTRVHPSATLVREELGAVASPAPNAGFTNVHVATGDLVGGAALFSLLADTALDDETVAVDYANPTATTWASHCTSTFTFSVPLLAPGATVPYNAPATIVMGIEMPEFDASSLGTFEPIVAPAAGLTIAGHDAFASAMGVGTAPTIEWTPHGDYASQFVATVDVIALTAVGADTHANTIARFTIPTTTFTFPPGILVAGQVYALAVTLNLYGYGGSLSGSATAVSSPFTP